MDKPKSFLDYYPNRIVKTHNFIPDWDLMNSTYRGRELGNPSPDGNYLMQFSDGQRYMSFKERIPGRLIFDDFIDWFWWHKSGRNMFDFSTGLLEMLAQTDAYDINVSYLKLPYEGVYVDISSANLLFAEGYEAKIEGVYVREINQQINGKPKKDLWFSFAGNYAKYMTELHNELGFSDGINFYGLDGYDRYGEMLSVRQSISQDYLLQFDGVEIGEQREEELNEVYKSFISRTIHLVINCLLYLMLPDKEVQQQELRPDVPLALQKRLAKATTKAKRKAVEADIRGLGFTRVNLVGASIRPRAERAASTDTVAPHWRRGHWRNQRIGARLQERKLTWIKPVVVNKKLGEPAKGHIYTVQSGPDTTSPSPATTR